MSDWSEDLKMALSSGNPAYMKAMLARVPRNTLQTAAPLFAHLGRTYVEGGQPREALIYFDQLIEIAPDNAEWCLQRADIHLQLGQLREALADANRVSTLKPNHVPVWRLLAQVHERLCDFEAALDAHHRTLELAPGDVEAANRIRALKAEIQTRTALQHVIDPNSSMAARETQTLPLIRFDPALLSDPTVPVSRDSNMVRGLQHHLRNYSDLSSPKASIARIEDPCWMAAWSAALETTRDANVLMHGSELGVLALRARHAGAHAVTVVEPRHSSARIAIGIVQKNQLARWHVLHGSKLGSWTEQERRVSFEEFSQPIEFESFESSKLDGRSFDYLAHPNLDHSLLGTGIVKSIRTYLGRGVQLNKILPSKAKVYAQGIAWTYPGNSFDLSSIDELRWSPYPQPLELPAHAWYELTEPTCVGEIDFVRFQETQWEADLPVYRSGRLNAIVFWFELEMGTTRLTTAPGSSLRCIHPAVQYCDALDLQADTKLHVVTRVSETRLYFQVPQPPAKSRIGWLPSWYVPMMVDTIRNEAYRSALQRVLQARNVEIALDIGAGCGLLSMAAAQSGAHHVYGCEQRASIHQIATKVISDNNLEHAITLLRKDVRHLCVPEDLPARAELVVFELFDCSLIGEGVLHLLAYARKHLLHGDVVYVPCAAQVHAMIIEYRLDQILGTDVNLLNPFRSESSFINVDSSTLPYRVLSEPFEVFTFDFAHATPTPEVKQLTIEALNPGTAGAVLFWFDLQLDEISRLSNAPTMSDRRPHFGQALQFIPAIQVASGSSLPLEVAHDGSHITFRWREGELSKEAFLSLPRQDARSQYESSKLEAHTRQLLQLCEKDPEQYEKVANLSTRIAIDPMQFDVDPPIAQRFARLFYD